ncbi:MAG: hypothetical protein NVSMB20_20500 [Bradyrhizobium sp.]
MVLRLLACARDVRKSGLEASFLAAVFDTVSAEYGDLETYFSDGLGVDAGLRARLQARYPES